MRFVHLIVACLLITMKTQAQEITLDKFFEIIKKNHPQFQKKDIAVAVQKKIQQGISGNQDWLLEAGTFAVYQKPINSSAFAPTKVRSSGYNLGLSKMYWKTGGRLSITTDYSLIDQNIPPIVLPSIGKIATGPSTFYQQRFFVTYIHPLLQNKAGKLDRLEFDLQEFLIQLTETQAKESEEAFLLQMGLKFQNWVMLDEQLKIARERLRLAKKQLSQAEKKRRSNLIDKVDVLRSEDAVRIAKQQILFLEGQWQALQAELAVLAQTEELKTAAPGFKLYQLDDLPTITTIKAEIKKTSRLLAMLDIQRNHLLYLQTGYRESLKAKLDLSLRAGLTQGKDTFTESLIPKKEDLSLSLNYRIPLGNRTAKAKIAEADLQIKKFDSDYRQVVIELEAAVTNMLIQIGGIEKVLLLNQEQIKSAGKKTAEELKAYNQGRGLLTFVIQSRDNEQNARLTYASNAKLYHDLVLQFKALTDQLLVN